MDIRKKLVELIESALYWGSNTSKEIADKLLENGVTVQEWVSVKDRLPENSKKEGALCPSYIVMTKGGESFGWYDPNFKSWFVLVWFFADSLLEEEIDFERADVQKIVKVPDGVVTHWTPMPRPPKGE